MKLDVSKEFANMRGYIDHITMCASLIGDEEVLIDLVRELSTQLVGMYDVKLSKESESMRALFQQKFDEVILEVGLKRLKDGKVA